MLLAVIYSISQTKEETMPTEKKISTFALTRYIFLLITMMLSLGACASTNRMMRITPFSRNEVSDPDRINLWPLLYKSHDRTSALWPLFDMDDQGFALRPLVALENDSVSLLGPLAGWDRKKDIWWVIPAYKFEKNKGVFPLYSREVKGDTVTTSALLWAFKDKRERKVEK